LQLLQELQLLQLLSQQLLLLLVESINNNSRRKLELVLRSVSVADASMDIRSINSTSLENKFMCHLLGFNFKKTFVLYMTQLDYL
jgi:hypothetical protein